MNLSQLTKNARKTLKRHSPEILTGIGVAGMLGTVVMAVRATPKAIMLIDEAECEKHEPLTKAEKVKVAWKPYIPAAITGVTSIACIVGASSVNVRRNAALATAYTLSETALKEYKDKVVETIGEKKEKTVRDAIAKDKIEKNPVSKNEVIVTEKGTTLCYDAFSGRYFKSDIDKIKRAENEFNRRLLNEDYLSLNEFYYDLGLTGTYIGDRLAWRADRGLVEIEFSSQLAEDGTPCLVLEFVSPPSYDF